MGLCVGKQKEKARAPQLQQQQQQGVPVVDDAARAQAADSSGKPPEIVVTKSSYGSRQGGSVKGAPPSAPLVKVAPSAQDAKNTAGDASSHASSRGPAVIQKLKSVSGKVPHAAPIAKQPMEPPNKRASSDPSRPPGPASDKSGGSEGQGEHERHLQSRATLAATGMNATAGNPAANETARPSDLQQTMIGTYGGAPSTIRSLSGAEEAHPSSPLADSKSAILPLQPEPGLNPSSNTVHTASGQPGTAHNNLPNMGSTYVTYPHDAISQQPALTANDDAALTKRTLVGMGDTYKTSYTPDDAISQQPTLAAVDATFGRGTVLDMGDTYATNNAPNDAASFIRAAQPSAVSGDPGSTRNTAVEPLQSNTYATNNAPNDTASFTRTAQPSGVFGDPGSTRNTAVEPLQSNTYATNNAPNDTASFTRTAQPSGVFGDPGSTRNTAAEPLQSNTYATNNAPNDTASFTRTAQPSGVFGDPGSTRNTAVEPLQSIVTASPPLDEATSRYPSPLQAPPASSQKWTNATTTTAGRPGSMVHSPSVPRMSPAPTSLEGTQLRNTSGLDATLGRESEMMQTCLGATQFAADAARNPNDLGGTRTQYDNTVTAAGQSARFESCVSGPVTEPSPSTTAAPLAAGHAPGPYTLEQQRSVLKPPHHGMPPMAPLDRTAGNPPLHPLQQVQARANPNWNTFTSTGDDARPPEGSFLNLTGAHMTQTRYGGDPKTPQGTPLRSLSETERRGLPPVDSAFGGTRFLHGRSPIVLDESARFTESVYDQTAVTLHIGEDPPDDPTADATHANGASLRLPGAAGQPRWGSTVKGSEVHPVAYQQQSTADGPGQARDLEMTRGTASSVEVGGYKPISRGLSVQSKGRSPSTLGRSAYNPGSTAGNAADLTWSPTPKPVAPRNQSFARSIEEQLADLRRQQLELLALQRQQQQQQPGQGTGGSPQRAPKTPPTVRNPIIDSFYSPTLRGHFSQNYYETKRTLMVCVPCNAGVKVTDPGNYDICPTQLANPRRQQLVLLALQRQQQQQQQQPGQGAGGSPQRAPKTPPTVRYPIIDSFYSPMLRGHLSQNYYETKRTLMVCVPCNADVKVTDPGNYDICPTQVTAIIED
ncbi:hypothetical protein DIPPA_09015 [Diplonema papillatum]|nr:hypothetical protein DIPPA_09015 [Diplonema papillatum]